MEDPNSTLDITDVDPGDLDTSGLEQTVLDSVDGTVNSLDLDNAISNLDVSDLIDPADVAANVESSSRAGSSPARRARSATQLLYERTSKRRAAAARAIGNADNALEIPALSMALRDRAPEVRRAASQSLAKIGGFDALGALRKAMTREPDPPTLRAMDKAIGAIEDRLFTGPGAGEPVTLTCADGRKFILKRKVPHGYCPYDGSLWAVTK